MIQLKKKGASVAPAILTGKGKAATEVFCKEYDVGARKFSFDSDIYGHEKVKSALVELQHGKCCFCESNFEPVAYGDVEHFRPKGGCRKMSR